MTALATRVEKAAKAPRQWRTLTQRPAILLEAAQTERSQVSVRRTLAARRTLADLCRRAGRRVAQLEGRVHYAPKLVSTMYLLNAIEPRLHEPYLHPPPLR